MQAQEENMKTLHGKVSVSQLVLLTVRTLNVSLSLSLKAPLFCCAIWKVFDIWGWSLICMPQD